MGQILLVLTWLVGHKKSRYLSVVIAKIQTLALAKCPHQALLVQHGSTLGQRS